MAKDFSRTDRVESVVKRELALLIDNEIKDPRIGRVTISAVKVSKDLSYARVYVTMLDNSQQQQVLKILNGASKFLRSRLAERLSLRVTPQLRFIYDEVLARSDSLLEKIDIAIKMENQNTDNNS